MSSLSPAVCPIPKRIQACERCKQRKIRCKPSECSSTCQRCIKNGFDCVFSEPTQRSRNYAARSNKTRSYLGTPPTSTSSPASESSTRIARKSSFDSGYFGSRTSVSVVSTPSAGLLDGLKSLHRSVMQKFLPSYPTAAPPTSLGTSVSFDSNPQMGQRTSLALAPELLEKYLQRFQAWNDYFPFVRLPNDHSVQNMREKHPFLLLGLLCSMTVHEVELNSRLHAELLRTMSERAIIGGEQNLDIIQGLLVQLAWYPFNLNPLKRQSFQMLQLIMSMILDLHFDTEAGVESYAPAAGGDLIDSILGVKRAYLGCYYLSSVIAVAFNRPFSLPFTDFAESFLIELEDNGAASVDFLVAPSIRLQRIAEEAAIMMRNTTADLDTIKIAVDELNLRLENMLPRIESYHHPTIILIGHYVAMQINAIDLRSKSSLRGQPSTHLGLAQAQPWRLEALNRCFGAAQAYFQCFTSFPLSEYYKMTTTEWASLIKVTTIMSILSFDIPAFPEWDAAKARQESHFGTYLESICYRMQQLIEETKDGDCSAKRIPNSFDMFKAVLEVVKASYDEKSKAAAVDSSTTIVSVTGPSACPVLNGGIQKTDYWDLLQDSGFMDLLHDEILIPAFENDNSVAGEWPML